MSVIEDPIGLANRPHYVPRYDWDGCKIQWGAKGVVVGRDEQGSVTTYETAFFEVFPESPSTFLRGEGDSIDEAEAQVWGRYQMILECEEHLITRRGYKNGAGFCKNCGLFFSSVFRPIPGKDESVFAEVLGDALEKAAKERSLERTLAWEAIRDYVGQLEAIVTHYHFVKGKLENARDEYNEILFREMDAQTST